MRLYLYGCASITNILCWLILFYLFCINNKAEIFFLYMTLLNFTMATIYITLKFILELRLHRKKGDEISQSEIKNSKIFKFISLKLSKFSFTLCMSVCICYWLLCLGGESLMTFPNNTFFKVFMGLYLHFFIGIVVFLEAFHSEVDFSEDSFLKDFLIFILFAVVYGTILVVLAKSFEKCRIYPFLSLDLNSIILLNIVLIIIFFNVYQMFYFLHRKKENNKLTRFYSNKSFTEIMI